MYLTVNTLLKDSELEELYEYLYPYYEAGLDAVIVQDMGVLRFVREHFPGLKIHVSTQMTLCSGYGAKLLKSMGASRIVPARELSLGELRDMKENSGIEIEAFIHGAMCYCYSGQCLFSSILGGRSGNRGRCAQPCRLPYSVTVDGKKCENRYLLSLKDMCTIEHIPELVEAGIDSFKIEGRMKKPEYAAGVTQIYRRYLDRYYELREREGTDNAEEACRRALKGVDRAKEAYQRELKGEASKKDIKQLHSLYIRSEVQDGYLFRRNGRDMISADSPAYSPADESLLDAIREKHLSSRLKLPVVMKAEFHVGEPAEILMYCTVETDWEHGYPHLIQAVVKGKSVEKALKQPVTEENIRNQLGKLGDSAFGVEKMEVKADADCFYPLKAINELRRAAVSELERQILRDRRYESSAAHTDDSKLTDEKLGTASCPDDSGKQTGDKVCFNERLAAMNKPSCDTETMQSSQTGYAISVSTWEQAEALAGWLASSPEKKLLRIYLAADLILEEVLGDDRAGKGQNLCRRLSHAGEVYAALPYILRKGEREYLHQLYETVQRSEWIQGFLVRSMDGLGFLESVGNTMPCRGDAGVYVWNQYSVRELATKFSGFCLPYELNASEQRRLLEKSRSGGLDPRLLGGNRCISAHCGSKPWWEKIVYGRIPMMITANCLYRTAAKCRREQEGNGKEILADRRVLRLWDRYHKEFPVAVDCCHCVNIIYNSVPLSLHQELAKWRGMTDLRIDFTMESPAEVRQMLDVFLGGEPFPQIEYTTGHEKRGVE